MPTSGWLLLTSLVRLPHDLIVGSVHSQKCYNENNFTCLILYCTMDIETCVLQCSTISHTDTTNSLTFWYAKSQSSVSRGHIQLRGRWWT